MPTRTSRTRRRGYAGSSDTPTQGQARTRSYYQITNNSYQTANVTADLS
ncbi:MAG: hypothetical protein IJQ81_16685 [Oscillibacter sp.]|nr:hypothetical protein [Oscillibacter sp.]